MHTHTATNDPRHNLKVALECARAGIPTFPALVKPPSGGGVSWSKAPLIKGWSANASTDEQQIYRWYRENPRAVPGIPLEHVNLIIFDPDRHGDVDGVAAWNRLVEAHEPLPMGPLTETPGNGLHFAYRQPFGKRLGNRSGNLPAGIDVRGYGGWIVAPGSMRSDGRMWKPKPGTPSLIDAVKTNTLPVVPQWLVDLIEPKHRSTEHYARPEHDFKAYAERTLTLICGDLARVREGRRNIELNNAAMRLGSMVARGWLDQHDVVDSLWRASEANGLAKEEPDKTQATIASGFGAGMRNPAQDPEDRPPHRQNGAHHRGQSGSTYSKLNGSNGSKPSFNWREGAISAKALMDKTFPDIVYVVPGILPEGVTLLVGRPKIGKSWWALDLCIAVASEDQLFMGGVVPGIRGDVLYLALEDNQRRLQRRLKKLLGKAQVPDRLTFHTEWSRVDQGGIEALTEWLDEHPTAKLIVVDTLQKVRPITRTDGYAQDYMAIEPLQKLAGERGISILVLHHDRKADADDVFDTISGTLGLTGSTDAMLILKRDPNVRFVLHGRGRDIEDFEKAMSFDRDTCLWRVVGDAEEARLTKERKAIITAIEQSKDGKGEALPIGPKDIAAACRMKEANVKVLLGNMLREGQVEKVEQGKYTLPKRPEQPGDWR